MLIFANLGIISRKTFFHFFPEEQWLFLIVPPVFAVSCAIIWRSLLSGKVYLFLRERQITTRSFGPTGAWDNFVNKPQQLHFISVRLLDGRILGSDQEELLRRNLDFPPDVDTDAQGNMALIVTNACESNTDEWESIEPLDEFGRTRFMYIPVSNIASVDAYVSRR